MALEKFRAPALPVPPAEYDQQYLTNLIRALRLYFNQLDSLTPNQAESYRADEFIGGAFTGNFDGGDFTGDAVTANSVVSNDVNTKTLKSQNYMGGSAVMYNVMASNFYGGMFYGDGQFINTPYNQFQSDQDQTAGALGTAYAVTMNIDDYPNGITIQNNSEITFAEAGIYLITFSIQFKNTTNDSQHVDIWFRYEGSDIASSNSRFGMPPRKSSGDPSHLIAVTPFVVDVVADGDQVQIMWHPSDIGVSIEHYPAVTASPGVTPAIPSTPSVIVTVAHVSAQHPAVQRVAPLGVLGFGGVGEVSVSIA